MSSSMLKRNGEPFFDAKMRDSAEKLNNMQQEILKQFRRNVADITPSYLTDTWLIKWLRAHSYNLKETERCFRGVMSTHYFYGIDSILDNFVKKEVISKYEYTSSLGIAKNGSPIRYTRAGGGDHEGFLQSLNIYDIILYCTYVMELDFSLLRKENKRTGRNVSEITYILDLENFSLTLLMSKSNIETAMDLIQLLQDHYPEIWGNILLINAPSYFDKIFNLFKPIIKLNMMRKIKMASRDNTPRLLLKYIDEDVLPAFLGGKRLDSTGNPRCTEFVKFGGKVPEEYYLRNQRPLQESDPGVTSLWVSPRTVFNYSVVVRRVPSMMRIELRTENGSIGLKMLFREMDSSSDDPDIPASDEYLDDADPNSNVRYISPNCRVQAHIAPVDTTINVPWKGIYIFRFDNSYSWFSSRKIIFRIQEIDRKTLD